MRCIRLATLMVVMVGYGFDSAFSQEYTWKTGAVGEWNVSENWMYGKIPETAETTMIRSGTANISTAGTYYGMVSVSDAGVLNIGHTAGTVDFPSFISVGQGGTLKMGVKNENPAILVIENQPGSAALTVTGKFLHQGGNTRVKGTWNVNSGGVSQQTGGTMEVTNWKIQGDATVSGTRSRLICEGSGDLILAATPSPAKLTLRDGATADFSGSDLVISSSGEPYRQGELTVTDGTLTARNILVGRNTSDVAYAKMLATGNSRITAADTIYVGNKNRERCSLEISGGTLTTNNLVVGKYKDGTKAAQGILKVTGRKAAITVQDDFFLGGNSELCFCGTEGFSGVQVDGNATLEAGSTIRLKDAVKGIQFVSSEGFPLLNVSGTFDNQATTIDDSLFFDIDTTTMTAILARDTFPAGRTLGIQELKKGLPTLLLAPGLNASDFQEFLSWLQTTNADLTLTPQENKIHLELPAGTKYVLWDFSDSGFDTTFSFISPDEPSTPPFNVPELSTLWLFLLSLFLLPTYHGFQRGVAFKTVESPSGGSLH